MIFRDEITILRPNVKKDRYGNDVADGTYSEIQVPFKVSVQPVSQVEGTSDRQVTVVTGWRVFTPKGRDLDLRPIDHVRWSGMDLEVVGEVARWTGHHVEADLRKVAS